MIEFKLRYVLLFVFFQCYSYSFAKASEQLDKAIELSKKNPSESLQIISSYLTDDYQFSNEENKLKVLHAASNAYLNLGDYKKSLIYAEKWITNTQPDTKNRLLSQLTKASTLFKLGKYNESHEIAFKIFKNSKNINDDNIKATIYNLWANILFVRGQIEDAINAFVEARKILIRTDEKFKLIKVEANLGKTLIQLGRVEDAIGYLESCDQRLKETKDVQTKLIVKINLASAYSSLEKFLKAESIYKDSINIAKNHKMDSILAACYINLSDLYSRTENWQESLKFGELALKISIQLDDPTSKAITLVNIGKAKAGLKDFDQTFECFKQALEIFESLNAKLQLNEVQGYFAEYYAKTGQFQKAHEYLKLYTDGQNEFATEKSIQLLKKLETEHNAKKQELKIQALEAEKKQQSLQSEIDQINLHHANTMRNILAMSTLLSLIIIFLLSKAYRIKTKANTELTDLHEELNKKNTYLNELNVRKDRMIAIVSHDLRNPLNGILGLTDHLRTKEINIQKLEKDEMIDMIEFSAQRALEIVKNLLESERINSGKLNLKMKESRLLFPVELAIKENEIQAKLKHQKMVRNFELPSEDLQIKTEKDCLKHIVSNLISNAIKYSKPKSNIEVFVKDQQGQIQIGVKDVGPGISSEDQLKLFLPFSTTQEKTTGGEHSIGLGLSIVKSLTEAMNGTVHCESKLGEGSLFYVSFPKSAEREESLISPLQ